MPPKKTPKPSAPKAAGPRSGAAPKTKQDALREMTENDPRKTAELLREILKNK